MRTIVQEQSYDVNADSQPGTHVKFRRLPKLGVFITEGMEETCKQLADALCEKWFNCYRLYWDWASSCDKFADLMDHPKPIAYGLALLEGSCFQNYERSLGLQNLHEHFGDQRLILMIESDEVTAVDIQPWMGTIIIYYPPDSFDRALNALKNEMRTRWA